jgi:glycosyltransferase involved in cell wall biosynthesis
MKIAVFDTNQFKFTQEAIDHWVGQGHEVHQLYTCHPPVLEWADVLWFDCIDGNLTWATSAEGAPMIKGKKIIARGIDIDVWAGHFQAVNFDLVDHLIFIAPHIKDYFFSRRTVPDKVKVHLIPCGVNTDKFTPRRDMFWNRDIAVVMRLWHGKGIDVLLQAIAELPQYTFHICGAWGMGGAEREWYSHYIYDFLKPCKNWMHVESVQDMNEWLEDKSYALLCSKKESFSYTIGECMSKGMHPLIHRFYGAERIWPEKYLWRTVGDLSRMLREAVNDREEYRNFIVENYPLSRMLEAFDGILSG